LARANGVQNFLRIPQARCAVDPRRRKFSPPPALAASPCPPYGSAIRVRNPFLLLALPQNLWVVFALVSGATVAFSEAWLGRSMAGKKKVALAVQAAKATGRH
jgi:hypothetical protein